MSSRMYGADIEQLRSLADLFDERSQALQGALDLVGSSVDAVPWFGPSSEMFRDEWDGMHAPALRESVSALAEVAERVRSNADDQESTSGELVDAGSGSGSDSGSGSGSGSDSGSESGSGSDSGSGSSPVTPTGGDKGVNDWWSEFNTNVGAFATAGGIATEIMSRQILRTAPYLDDLTALRSLNSFDDVGRSLAQLDVASGAFNALGVVTGGYQFYEGIRDGDPYYAADGGITAVLSAGAMIPGVNAVAAPAAAIWGGASLINGLVSDEPLTKNIADGVEAVGDFFGF